MAGPHFITLEGGEGAGKSTQLELLAESFEAAGLSAITTREPGGTPGAEVLRDLVVKGPRDAWEPITESLLFMAARCDHVKRRIAPALANGTWVLCDRFFDSTLVYQGIGKGVGTEWLNKLYALIFADFAPALTLLLDLDVTTGLARAIKRDGSKETRFEKMGEEYHQKIRDGFHALAKAEPNRIVTIDAGRDIFAIHQDIVTAVNARFRLALKPVAGA